MTASICSELIIGRATFPAIWTKKRQVFVPKAAMYCFHLQHPANGRWGLPPRRDSRSDLPRRNLSSECCSCCMSGGTMAKSVHPPMKFSSITRRHFELGCVRAIGHIAVGLSFRFRHCGETYLPNMGFTSLILSVRRGETSLPKRRILSTIRTSA